MTTKETDHRNRKSGSRSTEQTKESTQKKEVTPGHASSNPDTHPAQKSQKKQKETVTMPHERSTSHQSKSNTAVRSNVRRETDSTEVKAVSRTQEEFKDQNQNTKEN